TSTGRSRRAGALAFHRKPGNNRTRALTSVLKPSEVAVAQQSPSPATVPETVEPLDPLLQDYVRSIDDRETAIHLSTLISQHAEPIIRRTIRHKLNLAFDNTESVTDRQELEDLHGDAILEVFSVLRELKHGRRRKNIRDFRGYVATIGYRVCSTYLRKKRPQRASLKDRVRYLLSNRVDLAVWKNESEEWLCGRASWRDHGDQSVVHHLPDCSEVLEERNQIHVGADKFDLEELIGDVFSRTGKPVLLDALIAFLVQASGTRDELNEQLDEGLETQLAYGADVSTELEQRLYLERVWVEIAQLPVKQRTALLLNLTDRSGNGVIALLPGVGIASFREIAATLEMTAEQLAAVWGDLPLSDAAIAQRLEVTRQQVINLRKSARQRLMRRTRDFAQGAGWTERQTER
ncbi:MAG TPA: hypothetical protein VFV34_00035, partial [Blastocatellia bacterium]|nr:hypothetical protein [Blastocatellia bacterium]